MKLYQLIKSHSVRLTLEAKDKSDVLDELVDILKDDSRVTNLTKVRSAVQDREKITSTGVGKGVAVPHGKTDGVNEDIVVLARTDEGIDFDSHDAQPVFLFFLLIGKMDSAIRHLKLLSRIAKMMDNPARVEAIKTAKSAEEIISLIEDFEKDLDEIA